MSTQPAQLSEFTPLNEHIYVDAQTGLLDDHPLLKLRAPKIKRFESVPVATFLLERIDFCIVLR